MIKDFIKDNKKTIILTIIVTLLPILVGLVFWNRLPDVIATHFDSNNEPNGWSSKGFTVFGLPLIMVVLDLICIVAAASDPKKKNLNQKIVNVILWIIPACSVVCCGVSYAYALGCSIKIGMVCIAFIGVILMVLGMYLPKCRQNYTMGIRTKWALEDEDNWNATHRVGGWLFTIGGSLMVLLSWLESPAVIFIILAIVVAVPYLYSFLYFRKHSM